MDIWPHYRWTMTTFYFCRWFSRFWVLPRLLASISQPKISDRCRHIAARLLPFCLYQSLPAIFSCSNQWWSWTYFPSGAVVSFATGLFNDKIDEQFVQHHQFLHQRLAPCEERKNVLIHRILGLTWESECKDTTIFWNKKDFVCFDWKKRKKIVYIIFFL